MTVTTSQQPPRAGEGRDTRLAQLIVSLFGLYARAEGNWLSVASLVAMSADLGGDGQATRSSISRMKRRDILLGERRGGAAGYSASASTLDVLAEGDVRIFERRRATVEDGWVLVVFSVPEAERDKRHALRANLTRLGFGTAASGVWLAPGNLAAETRHALQRRDLHHYVDIFTSDYLAFGDLRTKVTEWWDLDELAALYADFLQRFRPALHYCTEGTLTPHEAFCVYVPMITQWRQLPYRDPGLPLAVLPPAWNGEAAGELFDALHRTLAPLAQRHAMRMIHGTATKPSR